MPSTGEGFGIVFLEALCCGTPVVSGDRDGSVDALDGGRLGRLVDPTDVNAIGQGIAALLKKQAPDWWFDRRALREAVVRRFGRTAFRNRVRQLFPVGT
jgi:glycosyltransferase involved in cell wall biosynthesis